MYSKKLLQSFNDAFLSDAVESLPLMSNLNQDSSRSALVLAKGNTPGSLSKDRRQAGHDMVKKT
jgi:hypothetical protein